MTLRTALLITALAVPSLALAVDELSYTYVQADYQIGEVDTGGRDVDFHKIGGTASYNLTENFALFGTGHVGEVETTDIGAPKDIDTRNLSAGLTAHFPLLDYDNVDVVIPMAIAYARARAGSVIESDTGYSIGIGVRALLTERIEVGAALQHTDIKDDEQRITGSARFYLTDAVSFALTGGIGNEVDTVGLNGRYSFE